MGGIIPSPWQNYARHALCDEARDRDRSELPSAIHVGRGKSPHRPMFVTSLRLSQFSNLKGGRNIQMNATQQHRGKGSPFNSQRAAPGDRKSFSGDSELPYGRLYASNINQDCQFLMNPSILNNCRPLRQCESKANVTNTQVNTFRGCARDCCSSDLARCTPHSMTNSPFGLNR